MHVLGGLPFLRPRATVWLVAAALFAGASQLLLTEAGSAQDGAASVKNKKLPNGIYKVLREGTDGKTVKPTKDDETVVLNDHRYPFKKTKEPPVFVVVHKQPEVQLVLAEEPDVVKDEKGLQIRLKLHADQAKALEQLTRENKDGRVAVIIGGEVVTVHKIRDTITGGAVQITNCNEEAGAYLVKHLKELSPKK